MPLSRSGLFTRNPFVFLFLIFGFALGDLRAETPSFSSGVAFGDINTPQIWEASGIVASRQNPGVLWTHNDNGFAGSIFALGTNGALLARCAVSNVYSGDFEDIAIGPGPSPGMQYIYLGDIGDNFSTRQQIRVFRIPEPAVYTYQSNAPPVIAAVGAQEIILTYPDEAHNAEALLIDPWTGDLYIATKGLNTAGIYQATRAQLESGEPVKLTFVRTVAFKSVSAGDISPDGSLIALRRSNRAEVWVRKRGDTISNALAGASINIPVIGQPTEPNGEGLGFDPAGRGYYTVSEGFNQPIYFFARTNSDLPREPQMLIPPGALWRYLDFGEDLDVIWRAPEFDDSYWPEGAAQFGYGQGDEQTTLYFGDQYSKMNTAYFRKQFEMSSLDGITNLALRVCFNDGIAVYLNGREVWRHNLAADAVFATPANSDRGAWQNIWWSVPFDPAQLQVGINTLAVEVHRYAPDGPDLSFDLQLVEGAVDLPARFTAAPQLSNDSCTLQVAGPVGSLVTIEASTDLREWTLAGRIALDSSGLGTFEESPFTSGSRFFRIAGSAVIPN